MKISNILGFVVVVIAWNISSSIHNYFMIAGLCFLDWLAGYISGKHDL